MKTIYSVLEHVTPGHAARSGRANKEHPLRDVLRSPDLRRVMPGLVISALLSNVLALALPLAMLQIMDRVVSNKSLDTLLFLVLGIIMALVLEETMRALNGIVTAWLGGRFEHNAIVAALDRLMRVPMRRYQSEEASAYAEKILASSKVADLYSGHALLVLLDIPFVVIFLAIIAIIGGWLVFVPIALLLVFTYLIVRYALWIREQVYQRHSVDDRRFNFLAEVLSNIQSVRTLTMEALMRRRYERLQDANASMVETLTYGNTMASDMGVLFSQVMVTSIIFAGALVVVQGGMTPGALAACMLLSLRALQPLLHSLSAWLRYQSHMDAKERLDEVMDLPCEDDRDKPVLPPVRGGLELRDISLSHEGGAPLFSGFSLAVKAGQCIAIQGDSGSGKTSLLSLIHGMLQPDSGSVLVDGRPIREFDPESIHREIAFLPQAGTVLVGTILENMTMFDDSLNKVALHIAEKVGLDRVVEGMKLGYETPLGEGTAEALPDGVSQIITIIRALVCNPSVILFDEANISLDMGGDKLLRDYLAELKGKCTMILVTHRPSMLALADQVYSLAGGRLIAGSLEESQKRLAGATPAPAIVVHERPARGEDNSIIVRRQFTEESDMSVCLCPLLDALGWKGRPRELAEAMPHMALRLDLTGLCSVMANLDLPNKHFVSTLERIDYRLLPCLYVPADRPAKVLLERLPNGRLRVFDSAAGAETEIDATPDEGEFYLFQEPDKITSKGRVESSWFGSMFWGFRRHIALVFLLTIITTLLNLAQPLFVMAIYSRVLPSGDVVLGGYLLLGVGIAILAGWFLRELEGRVMAYLGGRIEYILGTSVFQRIISLPASSVEGASVSHQVGRIKNLESLREFFLGPLATLAFDLPATLILLAVIALISPWLACVVLVAALAYTLLALSTKELNRRSIAEASYFSSATWDFLDEALTNMRAIRLVGARQLWVDRFKKLSAKATLAGFRNRRVQISINSLIQILGASTGFLTLAVAAVLAVKGELSGGAMLASLMLVWRVVGPIQNIFLSAVSLLRIRGSMNQIENLMRLKGERDGGVHQTIRPEIHGAISFSRVSFRYAGDADPAILGVTFSIKAGQVVVVAGPNGAGKSTLLKLVDRVYFPQAGIIRLDNIDIRQLNIADLRARVSYMPQNIEIFYGTVAQNLLLADPAATDEEMRWAVEMAGLMDDIQALPQGFETRISNSRSELLPQGFRQRLSLARTILKPASVVLLDEPGAGMDQAGEEALLRCIQYLRGRATVLMVSHRPAHMRLADTVIYMERGAVTAMGSFEQITDKVMAGLR